MAYIDGYLLAVPTAKKEEYLAMAKNVLTIWAEDYGLLSASECWGDDVPDGELTSMLKAVQCKDDETVVFSWVVWSDKTARDAAWKKCHDDPRFQDMPMVFDGKRMIFGGFTPLVQIP